MKNKNWNFNRAKFVLAFFLLGFIFSGFSQKVEYDYYGLILPWSDGSVVPIKNVLTIEKKGSGYKIIALGSESDDLLLNADVKFHRYFDWADIYSYEGYIVLEGTKYKCTVETNVNKLSEFIVSKKGNKGSFLYKKENQIKIFYWQIGDSELSQKSISLFPILI